MKAAYIQSQGDAGVIQVGDLPTPEPGPGQVRVRVAVASVNPIDLYLRSGAIAMPLSFPYIIGCDLAGRVDAVGPGVERFKPGMRVWASNQGLLGRQGATAEFAVVDEEWLHRTPDNVKDEEAAAWALVGITAHLGLVERANLKEGETVVITGGSGGVGSMAIQIAKALGARVICTAGSEDKASLCRALGADVVVNYKTENLFERARELSEPGVDVWLETQREPDLEQIIPAMAKRGRLVLMAGRTAKPIFPVGPFYTRNASILGFAMFNFSAREQQRSGEDMNRWAEVGALRAIVGHVFTLREAADAHRILEASTLGGAGHVVGKVVIRVDH
jgi:NADPH2:quinone reductase